MLYLISLIRFYLKDFVCEVMFSLRSLDTFKYDFLIKAGEMFSFLCRINSSISIGLSFLLHNHIRNRIIKDY